MAPSYIVSAAAVLSQLLPLIGVSVGTEALTTTLQTLIAIGAGLLVMYRQVTNGRSTLGGMRPQK